MPRAANGRSAGLPTFVRPQLCRLVETPPAGADWLHEIKFDGYRIHARIDGGRVKLLTRTGLNWTDRYEAPAEAIAKLKASTAYLDGELCAIGEDGVTSFAAMQAATDARSSAELAYFAFDLLWIDGEDLRKRPLVERKARLEALLSASSPRVRYSEHIAGNGPDVLRKACGLHVEGIVSKRADAPYVPGDRGIWTKSKCLNRQEFVVVGWTEPKGRRKGVGALLLGYHDTQGRLIYAGRVGNWCLQNWVSPGLTAFQRRRTMSDRHHEGHRYRGADRLGCGMRRAGFGRMPAAPRGISAAGLASDGNPAGGIAGRRPTHLVSRAMATC